MDDLTQELERARVHVDAGWDDGHTELALVTLHRRSRRRRMAAGALGALGVAGLLLGGTLLGRALPSRQSRVAVAPPAPVAVAVADRVLRFADGSTARPLGIDSEVASAEDAPARITAVLVRGLGRFDVVKRPARTFRVEAGGVTIVVIGTSFTVERMDARVGVRVHEGRVRVESAQGTTELGAGEHAWFASAVRTGDPGVSDEAGPEESPRPAVEMPGAAPRRASHDRGDGRADRRWYSMAEEGRYEDAYALLRKHTSRAVGNDPEELLVAADVARISGHARAALPYLRRITKQHPGDSRAPLAAFMVGRVYLEQLAEPRRAAESFAESRALAPEGSLAQDALAREIEAWSRAGEPDRARERAAEYLRLYPDGRRVKAVQRYGGIE